MLAYYNGHQIANFDVAIVGVVPKRSVVNDEY